MANEDKATRYHRLRRRASLLGTAAGALLLLGVLATGASAALRDAAAALAGGVLPVQVIVYVLALSALNEAVQLPFVYYQGVTLEHRYGLSNQTHASWWTDHLKSTGVGVAFGCVAAAIVYGTLWWSADYWWLWASALFSGILVVLAQLAPVLLLPLFYEFTPLDRPALRDRLVALADRAGARILGVFEWRLSDRTKKANAALAGIGRTRRILLSDTLLADHSDDEIEVILAHELAHHVHGDIWIAIVVETAMLTLGFYIADRILAAAGPAFGMSWKGDLAGLPLLVLAGGAVSIALMPVVNALSRAHERRADRYALAMTNNAAAFVTAMRRLGAQNLAEEQPSRLVEILFYTHPPLSARLEAARRHLPPQ